MWCAHRQIATASAPLRRVQHVRHPLTMARTSAIPWGKASCSCWSFDAHSQSKGFLRSYASRANPKPANNGEIDQNLNDKEITHRPPLKDRTPAPRKVDESNSSPFESLVALAALREAQLYFPPTRFREPDVRFDQSDPAPTTYGAQGLAVYPLEGYSPDAKSIRIYFRVGRYNDSNRHSMELSRLYLRDICQCSKCISPSSGRKTFATCDIPPVPRLRDPDTESIRLSTDGSLEITWEDDFLTGGRHTSVYSQELLNHLAEYNGKTYHYNQPRRLLWDASRFWHGMESRIITYSDWMEGGPEFAEALVDLQKRGLVIMREVPKSRYSVQRVAEKIGHLSSTIRGLSWDVVSQPRAEHVAGDNEHLRLHQDLLYSRNLPQVKFLHCLANECEGGVSLFSDGLRAAAELKRNDGRSFAVLSEQMVTFSHENAGNYLMKHRHVIQTSAQGENVSVSWSPGFQGTFGIRKHQKHQRRFGRLAARSPPFDQGPEDDSLQVWRKAARVFRDNLELPKNVVQYRLQPGDCVIFDNTRVLHGRTQVDASAGLRHLRGAYIDGETIASALMSLTEKGLLKRDSFESESEPWTQLRG